MVSGGLARVGGAIVPDDENRLPEIGEHGARVYKEGRQVPVEVAT